MTAVDGGTVVLRDWVAADAAWYVEQTRDPEILRFTTERDTLTTAEFHTALNTLRDNTEALGFVAVDARTGRRLANVAAARHGDVAEVSYWVAAAERGRGVAGHALSALCKRVRESWPVIEIRLWTHADNVASQRAARRTGFEFMAGAETSREVAGSRWPVRWYRRSAS